MNKRTPREDIIEQISYAIGVQTLVENGKLDNPEPQILPLQKNNCRQVAELAVEKFERTSLISEVQNFETRHGFWYGVGQALVAALAYSFLLAIIAYIVKANGIDVLNALRVSAP